MEYQNFKALMAAVNLKKVKKTVVVAAAHDEHALEAVLKAEKDGMVNYILVGIPKDIISIGKKLGYKVNPEWVVESTTSEESAYKAVELIKKDKGDFLMKGKLETGTLLKEVVNKETGIGTGNLMSHIAILEIPAYHKLLAFTDGGMIPYPNLEQKEGILTNSVDLFHRLGYECPKVAAIAAVETVNHKMQETVDADQLKKMSEEGKFGKCILEGPISFDLAVSMESATLKGYISPVTGEVDIILVPTIAAGNLVSKGLMYLAGATMAGCILGAKAPVVLTSRGASFKEKYYSLLLCSAL